MNVQKKELYVFDYDGVITDSVDVKTKAFYDMYVPYGEEIASLVVDYHLENGGISRIKKFEFCHKNFLKIDLNKEEIKILSNQFSSKVVDKVVESEKIKGVEIFLQKLRSEEKISAINTGTPTEEIIKILTRTQLNQYFHEVLGSPSSKIENLLLLSKKLGVKFPDIIFFGDSYTDLEAAKILDIDFVGVGNHIKQYSGDYKKSIFISDFNEIENF